MKSSSDFIAVFLFSFVKGSLGVFHTFQKVNQNEMGILGNYSTATMTACVLLCDEVEKCNPIFKWIEKN